MKKVIKKEDLNSIKIDGKSVSIGEDITSDDIFKYLLKSKNENIQASCVFNQCNYSRCRM